MQILTINETNFSAAVRFVCKRDADLAAVVEKHGEPPIWIRPAGFSTLIHIILEQQVSIASALATYQKLLRLASAPLTPKLFLEFDAATLKSIGYSRQKTLYSRELAAAIIEERLNLDALENLPDDAVKAELTKIKGIGRWTADVYLLMCLRRADAFPVGDLGVIVAVQKLKNLETRPTAAELEKIGVNWKPFRAAATRILWHFYLNQ